jgi:hypothetical protein
MITQMDTLIFKLMRMKSKLLNFLNLSLVGIAMLTIECCQNVDTPTISNVDTEDANFGNFHNEVISNIFDKLPDSQSRSNGVSIAEIKDVCIEEATESAIAKDQLQYASSKITIQDVSSQTIVSIKNVMSNDDKEVIDGVVSMINQNISIEKIKKYILHSKLPGNKKDAANNFVDTYFSSKLYWEENGEAWINYINTNVVIGSRSRSSWYDDIYWDSVAFSDAYYAWYGTLSSGCNLYVGAGAAAVGSVAAVLNQL